MLNSVAGTLLGAVLLNTFALVYDASSAPVPSSQSIDSLARSRAVDIPSPDCCPETAFCRLALNSGTAFVSGVSAGWHANSAFYGFAW